ncbi:MAG: GMC oxidoreductase, partial [Pseudomonadota bacterium]
LSLASDDSGQMRCVGATLKRAGVLTKVTAREEVILSAGAIGSPQILQLSGIGDGSHLQSCGVEVRHTLAGVGKNLQDHLQLRTIYRVQGVKTLNELASTLVGKARIGLEYALTRSGPMSMAPSQLGIFTKSSAAREHANIQFHVQPLSLESFGQPLHPWPGITASVCNLNPTSRGTVLIKSSRAGDAPEIAPNYLATDDDRQVAADSIRVVRRITEQAALSQYKPQEVKPGPDYASDQDLARAAGDIGTTIFHPVGTAKMGRADDPTAVVDSHLRVHGVNGLRVVDASVMPTITSGNTNSPTLMIAEKAARWIAAGV